MLEKRKRGIEQVEILCMDDKVPQDYLLRKIDNAIDFTHIYDLVEDLYCKDNGRPSIDPVVLFKIVLIQHLYGTTITAANSKRHRFKYRISMVLRIQFQ